LCSDCRNSDVKILDTHLGSGSIAIACHDYGFELTACELDTEYYNSAIKRINNHLKQTKLNFDI
jgi:site-specific DNA-methyltransferase (adenine-specific)